MQQIVGVQKCKLHKHLNINNTSQHQKVQEIWDLVLAKSKSLIPNLALIFLGQVKFYCCKVPVFRFFFCVSINKNNWYKIQIISDFTQIVFKLFFSPIWNHSSFYFVRLFRKKYHICFTLKSPGFGGNGLTKTYCLKNVSLF